MRRMSPPRRCAICCTRGWASRWSRPDRSGLDRSGLGEIRLRVGPQQVMRLDNADNDLRAALPAYRYGRGPPHALEIGRERREPPFQGVDPAENQGIAADQARIVLAQAELPGIG